MQPKLGVTVLTLSARRLYKWKMDRRCFSLSNYNFERFELELGKKLKVVEYNDNRNTNF